MAPIESPSMAVEVAEIPRSMPQFGKTLHNLVRPREEVFGQQAKECRCLNQCDRTPQFGNTLQGLTRSATEVFGESDGRCSECEKCRCGAVNRPSGAWECSPDTETRAKPTRCGDINDIAGGDAIWGMAPTAEGARANAIAACEKCLLQAQTDADAPAAQYDCGTCLYWDDYWHDAYSKSCSKQVLLAGKSPCRAVDLPFAVVASIWMSMPSWVRMLAGDLPGALEYAAAAGATTKRTKLRVRCGCY